MKNEESNIYVIKFAYFLQNFTKFNFLPSYMRHNAVKITSLFGKKKKGIFLPFRFNFYIKVLTCFLTFFAAYFFLFRSRLAHNRPYLAARLAYIVASHIRRNCEDIYIPYAHHHLCLGDFLSG